MYDLHSDPLEISNLYANPNYAGVRQRLTAELERLRGELAVPAEDPPETVRPFPPRTRPARSGR
jgi:hypothetical protein